MESAHTEPKLQQADWMDELQQLVAVVAQLRSPTGGCPWDLAQTPETLIPYVIEEAYETVDAIQSGDSQAICEELGDLLLQVVLQAQIASESAQFDLGAVAKGIREKLIRRHPHVFGEESLATHEEVRERWEAIKAAEKGEDTQAPPPLSQKLAQYGRSLPPLMASLKISQKAAKAGFEWETVDGVWAKFEEELAELKEAIAQSDPTHQQEELGDLLFTIINVARWHDLDPSTALQGTNRRFIQRLQLMEAVATRPLEAYTLAELEDLWQHAKAQLKQGSVQRGQA